MNISVHLPMYLYRSFYFIYTWVELLGHRVCLCSNIVDTAKEFAKVIIPIYMSISKIWILIIWCPGQYLELSLFYILVILVNVDYNCIVVLISFFYWLEIWEHFIRLTAI